LLRHSFVIRQVSVNLATFVLPTDFYESRTATKRTTRAAFPAQRLKGCFRFRGQLSWHKRGAHLRGVGPDSARSASTKVDPFIEIAELESLWQGDRAAFYVLNRRSKWGDLIAEQVIHPLKRDEPQAVEDAVIYLEANGRYFRSGYAKARIAAILKSKTLTEAQRARLREVLLAAPESPKVGSEFVEYARLALVVGDGTFFRKLAKQADTDDPRTQARCQWILNLYAHHGSHLRTSR
jgi:hypothetical protein